MSDPHDYRRRQAERLAAQHTPLVVGVLADLVAIAFAYSLWGWKGSALLVALWLSRESAKAREVARGT